MKRIYFCPFTSFTRVIYIYICIFTTPFITIGFFGPPAHHVSFIAPSGASCASTPAEGPSPPDQKNKKKEDLDGGVKEDLVGGFLRGFLHPSGENISVKVDHFPNFQDENKNCLSCHHLEMDVDVLKYLQFFTQIQHQSVVGFMELVYF